VALTTFDVFVDVLQDLGVLNVTTATGTASKTAIVDSKIISPEVLYEDDEFNLGYMFIIRTSDNLAPQGEYQQITDFVGSTGTFTVDTFTANVESGDVIGFTNTEYPPRLMLERLNTALRSEKIGDIILVDTSLTTVSGQTEYALPVALKRNPFKVEIQTSTTSGDYEYKQIYSWQYVPAAAGSTGKLVLSSDPDAGKLLRIWYVGRPSTMSVYSSVIPETIPPEVVRYALMVEMMSWQNARNKGEDAYVKEEWNKYSALLDEALLRWERPLSKRRASGIILPDSNTEVDICPSPV
jgi:hypothetical protein